jgi:hypothetical protein
MMIILFLLVFHLHLAIANRSISKRCGRLLLPSKLSYHTLCTKRETLSKCLHGDQYVNDILRIVPKSWPLQKLKVTITNKKLPDDIIVRLIWVDTVGNEVEYSTYHVTMEKRTFTFSTYSSHSWRLYIGSQLINEISPDTFGQLANNVPLRQHIEAVIRHGDVSGVLSFYENTFLNVKIPMPLCPSSAPMKYYQPIEGKSGLAIASDPYYDENSLRNSVENDQTNSNEVEFTKALANCKEHVNMWTPQISSWGSAILYTPPSDNEPNDNFESFEMDGLIGSTVAIMGPKNRVNYYVTHQLSIPLSTATLNNDRKCTFKGTTLDILTNLRDALLLTNLTFFDAVYVNIESIDVLPYHCVPTIVEFMSKNVILAKLSKKWGFVNHIITSNHMKYAWSHSILNDLYGPSAKIQQKYSNLGAPKNHSYINPNKWQLLMETNKAGVMCWTASCQILMSTYVNINKMKEKLPVDHIHRNVTGFQERDYTNVKSCTKETLSAPFMSVSIKRTASSLFHPDRPNSDVLCGAGGIPCTIQNTKYVDSTTSSLIDWRDREEPGTKAKLDNEHYILLKGHAETAWNNSVIWKNPDIDTSNNSSSGTSNVKEKQMREATEETEPVPWTTIARKKRFVIDNIMSKKECQLLIQVAKKYAVSGAAYSGEAKYNAAANLISAASWETFKVDQSTEEREEAAKLYMRAISRIRAAIINYFNLTQLYLSTSTITARLPGGEGHPIHSDDCIWRDDRGICEPSNKVHECCVNYHYSAIMFMSPQGGIDHDVEEESNEGEEDDPTCDHDSDVEGEGSCSSASSSNSKVDRGKHLWKGSRFFWHQKMRENITIQEIEKTMSYPKRTRVNNRCGRLVGFSAGEENPHGVETIGHGPDADETTALFNVKPAGDLIDKDYIENKVDWSHHARWALTSWFSTDYRYTSVNNELNPNSNGKKYTVNPLGTSFRQWLKTAKWGEDEP